MNKKRKVALIFPVLIFLLSACNDSAADGATVVESDNQDVNDVSSFYKQSDGGLDYWWIANNTRRWLNKECAISHEAAGAVAELVKYGDIKDLPRDPGPCPSVNMPEPTDPEPTDPEPTDPEPTDPEPTDPEPTDPEPTDPEPTDPEPTDPEPTDPEPPSSDSYKKNLEKIKQSSVRNTNHDSSSYRNTPSNELVIANHLGPRSEYLGNPGGNPEPSFPVAQGGQNRTACEFSHFAYDDPLVHPNKPGAAHLHMFFGNTDVNAYSTYDTLIDSGSSTCNGQELNRTGYWAPAMFDGSGNVRIPERVVVYYKGEGLARGNAQVYPEGAAMIPKKDINTIPYAEGGAEGKFSFVCSDQYSGASSPAGNTMPSCDGDRFLNEYGVSDNPHVVLEMNVKFPQCWNGKDPSNPDNFYIPRNGGWYYSDCGDDVTLPNLEYFINYRVELGENTADWYLSSDVDPMTYDRTVAAGSSHHADWWGGWHKEVNKQWIDNCVNLKTDKPSGCGFGYLTDGGPDNNNPYSGPALKYRPQYTGPSKVPAERLFDELCETSRAYNKEEDAAYCNPMMMNHNH